MPRELTEAEKAKPYSKYYYRENAPAPKEALSILDKGPIDPSLATTIHQCNDLLKPGYLPTEIGFCKMPDGTGFIAMKIDMPDATAEMIEWWFAWFGLESLRYMIWDPDAHYASHVIDEHLEHRLDPNLNNKERRWGTRIIINEDIGLGAQNLYIDFLSPEEFGHDTALLKPPIATINNINLGLSEIEKPVACASHLYQEIPGGLELRARFWLGWHIVDKKPVQVSDDVPFPLVKGLAYHCAYEYPNLAAILPKVYHENVNVVDHVEDFRN